MASCRTQFGPNAFDDDLRPRHHLRTHSDDNPTGTFEQCDSFDVPRPLSTIAPVLDTVVFDRDFPFPPTHVDANAKLAKLDLSFGGRQATADQDEAQSAFLWRLRATISQFEAPTQFRHAASSAVAINQFAHRGGLDCGGVQQRIQDRNGLWA